MLNILKCPKCGAPALCSPSLSDAATLKCSKCGFADYLKAFKGEGQDSQTHSATPPLGIDFMQEMAKTAQGINALRLQGSIDGYVKQTCLRFNLSPWTLIEAVNAYLRQYDDAGSHAPNPLRFVTLQSGHARIDDLMTALRTEIDRQKHRSAPAPRADEGSSPAADEWIDRYNQLQTELKKKEKSYQTLLAAYRQAQATLEENGLA